MPTTMRRAVSCAALVACTALGCRSAAPAKPATPSASVASPWNDVAWVISSAEYRAIFVQTYAAATAHVERVAAGRAAGSWGVVLDADETVISNAKHQDDLAKAGLSYTKENWAAWTRRREATPLPGAAAFLARVHQLGGRVAIVTNRLVSECPDTEAVLRAHALEYDVILCRPDDGPGDKNPRFEMVRAGKTPAGLPPLEIVAFVGDNILDFPGQSQAIRDKGPAAFTDFGARFFILPNPMYGSWQR